MQTNPAVEQNLFAWCIQHSITEAWTNLCTKYPATEKTCSASTEYRCQGITRAVEWVFCVNLHPKLNPSNPGFCPHTNPGLRVWKRAGYPGFWVPGLHSLMCTQFHESLKDCRSSFTATSGTSTTNTQKHSINAAAGLAHLSVLVDLARCHQIWT